MNTTVKELKLIIDKLEVQVKLLLQRNRLLKEESEALKSENERLKGINAECELEIESQQRRIKAMLLAGSFLEGEKDKKIAQKTLSKILREIDDCIALVNKGGF